MDEGALEAVEKEISQKMSQKFHSDMANGEVTRSTWARGSNGDCIVV
jgi:hypothetical protein